MLRGIILKSSYASCPKVTLPRHRLFCERRRRKGDGTKTDILEERAAASQDEYFRKKTARQLEKLRDRMKKELEEGKKKQIESENSSKDSSYVPRNDNQG